VNPSSRDCYKRTPLIEAAMSGRFLGRPDDFVRNQAYEKEAEKYHHSTVERGEHRDPDREGSAA
jgi:hypothetical protein